MKWYWILAIVLISVIVGYFISLMMPAQKVKSCDCIQKDKYIKKLRINLPNISPGEKYLLDLINRCCKPPIEQKQFYQKGYGKQLRLRRKIRSVI